MRSKTLSDFGFVIGVVGLIIGLTEATNALPESVLLRITIVGQALNMLTLLFMAMYIMASNKPRHQ